MLDQVQAWAAINSGTRNLRGLADMAAELADAFSSLPGSLRLIDPEPVEILLPDGRITQGEHGRHLHLNARPEAPVRILLSGHMDAVFAVDQPYQMFEWLVEGMLNALGVADMKCGIALMLAAFTAFATSLHALILD